MQHLGLVLGGRGNDTKLEDHVEIRVAIATVDLRFLLCYLWISIKSGSLDGLGASVINFGHLFHIIPLFCFSL